MKPKQLKSLQEKGISVTPEMLEAFLNLSVLKQDIAIGHLSGMTHLDSYNTSKGKAKTDKAKIAGASEILSNPDVIAFCDHARADKLSGAIMGRDEALEKLTGMARLDANVVAQFEAIAPVDVNRSIKQLSDMQGWDSAKKHEVTGKNGAPIEIKDMSDDDFSDELSSLGIDEP